LTERTGGRRLALGGRLPIQLVHHAGFLRGEHLGRIGDATSVVTAN